MDKNVKQSIDARKQAIFAAYQLDKNSEEKVQKLFAEIESLGSKFQDVGEFEAEFAKSPLNQKYLDLFTEIATSSQHNSAAPKVNKGAIIGGLVSRGVAEGVADRAVNDVKRKILPTRAAVHQKAYDEARKVPGLGEAINVSEKASYAAYLAKIFRKKKD